MQEALKDSLNIVHMPADSGEYTEDLARIMGRIPDGWGRWIGVSRGWYPIIIRLDKAISELVGDYELHQVKEKFGSLRYYCEVPSSEDVQDEDRVASQEAVEKLISAAEHVAGKTCEECGGPGELCKSPGVYTFLKTLCLEDADLKEYLTVEEYAKWWEVEKPLQEARERKGFLDRVQKRATLWISQSVEPQPSWDAPRVKSIEEAREAAGRELDEVWVNNDEWGRAYLDALRERYQDHVVREQARQAKLREEGAGSFVCLSPEGLPRIIQIEYFPRPQSACDLHIYLDYARPSHFRAPGDEQ